jgi:hypothetical protein
LHNIHDERAHGRIGAWTCSTLERINRSEGTIKNS